MIGLAPYFNLNIRPQSFLSLEDQFGNAANVLEGTIMVAEPKYYDSATGQLRALDFANIPSQIRDPERESVYST
ncbi:hypothetical protein R1flu_007983 [Riccia fluitans]|uniref:Uncharacterized protein n=1 Tax=Riccia fluitans TaxID=41844 RepID=A0ABD1YAF5_9MARC